MKIHTNQVYFLHNTGNNNAALFHCHENYLLFLYYFKMYVMQYCHVYAWCLLPESYVFQIAPNRSGAEPMIVGSLQMSAISNGVRLMQSKYAQQINKRQKKVGSLFTQKAKATPCKDIGQDWLNTYSTYVEEIPCLMGRVQKPEEWIYSSFHERNGRLNILPGLTQI
ncbi:MAG: hypothetical protein IPN29_04735 [Saprospiraceae bacterium]|nr:hypothetical protein [Saprospiraceae bacterium]